MPPDIFFSLPFCCSPDFAFLRVFAKSLLGVPRPLVLPDPHKNLTGLSAASRAALRAPEAAKS